MRGQIWSSDLALSLFVFALASAIAYTMIANVIEDTGYADVTRQATASAAILVSDGYPVHWTKDTVVRGGIANGRELSLRKATALGNLSPGALYSSLRATDQFYVYIVNSTNHTLPFLKGCGVGSLSVMSVPGSTLLTAYGASALPLSQTTVLQDLATLGVVSANSPDAVLTNLAAADVLILDQNQTTNISSEAAGLLVEEASARGITAFVVGDPALQLFGITVNATIATTITTQGALAAELQLPLGAIVTLGGPTIIPTIEQPDVTAVSEYAVLGITDTGKAAYATWLYNDARVWYIATSAGTLANGTAVRDVFTNAAERFINISWPQCSAPQLPNASYVAAASRLIPHHDELMRVQVLVWRI